jgi:hypothetical protein
VEHVNLSACLTLGTSHPFPSKDPGPTNNQERGGISFMPIAKSLIAIG